MSFKFQSRSISHYISTQWLKEPFDIGYPRASKEALPKAPTSSTASTASTTSTAPTAPNAPLESSDYTPIYPRPVDCRGIDLYGVQSQISSKSYLKQKWNNLDETTRRKFIDGPNIDRLYRERLRIWKGYETVEYRKRYHSSWNPYPSLGLFPWEIVKDKLRHKKQLFDFELDYYDVLIKEAFGRNALRTAKHIFYTDYCHNCPDKVSWTKLQKEYAKIDPTYYVEKEARRQEQALMNRTKYGLGFMRFYETILNSTNSPRPLLEACRKWEYLGKVPQKDRAYTSSTEYREKLLDIKTSIVMDYIYYTGGVIGADKYHWVQDRQQKCGNFKYLNKVYTDEYI